MWWHYITPCVRISIWWVSGFLNSLVWKTTIVSAWCKIDYCWGQKPIRFKTVPTRGQNILDVFITNVPYYWLNAKVIKSLVWSNHLAVLIKPVVKKKAIRKTVEFHNLRQHNKWWSLVNNVRGRANSKVHLSTIFDPKRINEYF